MLVTNVFKRLYPYGHQNSSLCGKELEINIFVYFTLGDNVTSNSQCEKNCKCYLEGNEYKIGCDIFGCKGE